MIKIDRNTSDLSQIVYINTMLILVQLLFLLFELFINVRIRITLRHSFWYISNKMQLTQFIYFWKTALHVSGGIFTHHQEHI